MSQPRDDLKARASAAIDARRDEIVAISEHVMRHPETGFREFSSASYIDTCFDRMGLPHRGGLARTGTKARLKGRRAGPGVAILGELDSLLVSGHPFADPITHAAHACGHNAQLASMIGAGIGLQAVIDELDGDVVLFAVPAEELIEVEWRLDLRAAGDIEFLTGKAELIRLGEFDDIDVAMLSHTSIRPEDLLASVGDTHNGSLVKFVEFSGRASHAGVAPHLGINALKAATLALAAIDAQRETFRDDDHVRVHPILTRGGEAVSAVPADVRFETFVRGRTNAAISDAAAKVDRSVLAGALALGATAKITTIHGYLPQEMDPTLVALMKANIEAVVGAENVGTAGHSAGSTDVGDVGSIIPEVHPRAGGIVGSPHSAGYWVVDHVTAAVNPAKFMAMTVIDLLANDARGADRVRRLSPPKLSKAEYLELVRSRFSEVTVGL